MIPLQARKKTNRENSVPPHHLKQIEAAEVGNVFVLWNTTGRWMEGHVFSHKFSTGPTYRIKEQKKYPCPEGKH
jgi:hypothetical protein